MLLSGVLLHCDGLFEGGKERREDLVIQEEGGEYTLARSKDEEDSDSEADLV